MDNIVREDNVHVDDVNGIAFYDRAFAGDGKYSGILLDSNGKVSHLVTINPPAEEIEDAKKDLEKYKNICPHRVGKLPSGIPVILDSLEHELGQELLTLPQFIAAWLQDKNDPAAAHNQTRFDQAITGARNAIMGDIISHSKQWAKHLSLGEQSPETIDRELSKLAERTANQLDKTLAAHLVKAMGRIRPNLFSEQLSPDLLNGLIQYYKEAPKSAVNPNRTE